MSISGFPISDAFRSAFSPAIRERGEAYARQGKITIIKGTDLYLLAMAKGSWQYGVEIAVEEEGLFLSCTCPYYEGGELCKHIWGAIIVAEARGCLAGDGEPLERNIIFSYDDDEDDDYEDEYSLDDDDDNIYTSPSSPVSSWARRLQIVEENISSTPTTSKLIWPPTRTLSYVLSHSQTPPSPLRLEIRVEELQKNGNVVRKSISSIAVDQIAALPDPLDRRIFSILAGARSSVNPYDYRFGSTYSMQKDVALTMTVPDILQIDLLPLLAATGRAFRMSTATHTLTEPLMWDDGPPWKLSLRVAQHSTTEYIVDLLFKRLSDDGATVTFRRFNEERLGDEIIFLPDTITTGGIFLFGNTLARFDAEGADAWLAVVDKPSIILSSMEVIPFLEYIYRIPIRPELDLPEDLRFEEVIGTPRPQLMMHPGPEKANGVRDVLGDLTFNYEGLLVPFDDKRERILHAENRQLLVRNSPEESIFSNRLQELGFRFTRDYSDNRGFHHYFQISAKKLPRVVRSLITEEWHVEAEGRLYRSAISSSFSIDSGIDWFELHGSIDFDGISAELPELLAALRKGEPTVLLDDGTFGLIPEEWLERFARVAKLGKTDETHIRFDRRQVGLLDALLMAQPEITSDALFAEARQELLEFRGILPVEPTNGFKGTLRPYQKEGLGWLLFLQRFGFGGCLADDMGLGKTIQVLALLETRRLERDLSKKQGRKNADVSVLGPSLIVVPKSVVFNWIQEGAHFTPKLQIMEHTGPQRAKSPEAFSNADVILTTYATLRSDVLMLKDIAFDYVILDESQAIKNPSTQTAKAARVLNASHRLALSGTPVENHLGELWSLFEFLNPGLLGTSTALNLSASATEEEEVEQRKMIARTLRPFLLRRTKDQVASDLPTKLEQTIRCELGPQQRRLYNQLRKHYQSSLLGLIEERGINQSKIQILEALLRLRQAACHPGLVDKKHLKDESTKLETLMPMLADVIEGGSKALIFSQFTSLLALVRHELDKQGVVYEYLDGKTRNRQETVKRFKNDPTCQLFLISLKAGGVGLNLTEAEYVFLLDPWWNPAVEAQAIDRTHRIGQTRPVFAYRLIAGDTVEERILELQETKKDLASAIIGEANSVIRSLGREDLELLLS
jgi:superfamily II DNA or RNA helicase